ncbi:MAG: hypothetical protein LEGION0403_FIIPPAGN_00371 [Legionella sp.]
MLNKDNVDSYKNLTKKIQLTTFPEMKILGEILTELSNQIAINGVIPTRVPLNPLIINAETHNTPTILGFFNTGLEKKSPMIIRDDISEQQCLSNNPKICSL